MLVICNLGGMGNFLHRKQGVTQGDPLSMILYGIGILPLIRKIREEHPLVTKTWYANDAGARGSFGDILRQLEDLMERGPSCSYFPDPTKIILVIYGNNVQRDQKLF